MKAIVYTQYGPPEVLQLKEMDQPVPKNDQVLVKVHATSVNSWDWDWLIGKPYIYRLLSGITKPKLPILGTDIAGMVVQIGSKVSKFKVGDEVFGDLSEGAWGGFAEFVCAKESEIMLKPPTMTFEQAASIPQAGCMALQGLTEKRTVNPGDKVLINGAGGGVGTFAIQIAKSFGAQVTAVDLAEKHSMLQSIGADYVIDYATQDFAKTGEEFDLIIDVIATRSASSYKKALRPGGVFVMIGGKIGTIIHLASIGALLSSKEKKLTILAHQANKYLHKMIELFEAGKLKPIIDTTFPLPETPKAIQRIGDGKAQGKLVIKIY